jgi:predicted glycosyltransferase
MFFKYFVDTLKEDDHEILCTGREYREAKELAKIKNLDIHTVGKHGGDNKFEKLKTSTERAFLLSSLINSFKPDLTVSFSSPEASRVAFGLGVKHYIFNDSPHATAVAKLTVPLADRLFCPWVIPLREWTKLGLEKDRITQYKALDPIVWIKKELQYNSREEISIMKKKLQINNAKKTVLIRPEEIKASYITDKKVKSSIKLIDEVIKKFSDEYNILILARYLDQVNFYKYRFEKMEGTKIIETVTNGNLLLKLADLFIGAGGTMSAEAALMGKPVISITPINFYVEKYLIKLGLIKKVKNTYTLTKYIKTILSHSANKTNKNFITYNTHHQDNLQDRSLKIISKMEDPIEIFKKFLIHP